MSSFVEGVYDFVSLHLITPSGSNKDAGCVWGYVYIYVSIETPPSLTNMPRLILSRPRFLWSQVAQEDPTLVEEKDAKPKGTHVSQVCPMASSTIDLPDLLSKGMGLRTPSRTYERSQGASSSTMLPSGPKIQCGPCAPPVPLVKCKTPPTWLFNQEEVAGQVLRLFLSQKHQKRRPLGQSLVVLQGLPGSGKSFVVEWILDKLGMVAITMAPDISFGELLPLLTRSTTKVLGQTSPTLSPPVLIVLDGWDEVLLCPKLSSQLRNCTVEVPVIALMSTFRQVPGCPKTHLHRLRAPYSLEEVIFALMKLRPCLSNHHLSSTAQHASTGDLRQCLLRLDVPRQNHESLAIRDTFASPYHACRDWLCGRPTPTASHGFSQELLFANYLQLPGLSCEAAAVLAETLVTSVTLGFTPDNQEGEITPFVQHSVLKAKERGPQARFSQTLRAPNTTVMPVDLFHPKSKHQSVRTHT